MSLKTKKRFKNIGKTIGIALFALLMFTNIKIAMLDDSEIASGDISLLGVEINLFDATYGELEAGDYDVTCKYNSLGRLTETICKAGGKYKCYCPYLI